MRFSGGKINVSGLRTILMVMTDRHLCLLLKLKYNYDVFAAWIY
jgi:hypothetical protein